MIFVHLVVTLIFSIFFFYSYDDCLILNLVLRGKTLTYPCTSSFTTNIIITHFTKSIKMNAETVMKQATGSKFDIEDALSKIE